MTGRANEFAVRTALGGTQWRIVRQLLTENILLSLGGAALGLLIAQWALYLILSHMPADVAKFVSGWNTIRLDSNAFLFTLAIAVASGLISGIAPSLLTSRTNVSESLKESGRSSVSRARGRLRGPLVVAAVSLAPALLVESCFPVRDLPGCLYG